MYLVSNGNQCFFRLGLSW